MCIRWRMALLLTPANKKTKVSSLALVYSLLRITMSWCRLFPPLKVAMTTMAEHVKQSPALIWLLSSAASETESDSILR